MALRWGFAAAGNISHDFVNALTTLSKDEHRAVAVAARDLSRAQQFAKRFDIPKAYGNYLELAQDPNVEIVHVGAIHTQHLSVASMMLEHGKHVLCEVPMGINAKQVQQLVALAKEKNLFLVEGIWTGHFLSYQYIRQQIQSGALGEIKSVDIDCGVELCGVERLMKKETAGGGLLEFGAFAIQVCQLAIQQEPKSIKATGKLNENGVDVDVSAELAYGDGKVATLRINMMENRSNSAKIVGEKGQVTIPTLWWCPTVIVDVDGSEKSWPLPEAKHQFNYPNSCGLRYEADEVRKCIRAGKKECEYANHNESILIARTLDEIRKQIGVKYAADD